MTTLPHVFFIFFINYVKNSNSLFGFESFLQLEPICCTNQWKIALGTLQEGKTKTWDLRGLNYAKMHLTVTRDAFSWPCVIFCIVDQLVIQTFWDLKCAKKGLKQKLTKIGLALNKIVSKWPKIWLQFVFQALIFLRNITPLAFLSNSFVA